ncbi:MAG TPA: hypothetical protein VNK43_04950 [Gemmatimonadales bacterium]|nr:hypothetical protein [Gemmatimonadales bacterium]
MYFDDELAPWETGGDLPWKSAEDDEAWRGDLHFDGWPEEFAGPEYWLNKRPGPDRPGL